MFSLQPQCALFGHLWPLCPHLTLLPRNSDPFFNSLTSFKSEQLISDYFGKVRSLIDSLALTDNNLPDKEAVTYLLNGLGPTYEAFMTSVTKRVDLMSSHQLYQLLLIHESRVTHQNWSTISLKPSVNYSVTGQRDQRGLDRGNKGRVQGCFWNNFRGGHSSLPTSAPQVSDHCAKLSLL